MFKRAMMILLVMSLALMFVAQASAKVCVARAGGKCLLWSGSLICEIAGIGLGNCEGVYLGCNIDGSGNWAVACGAPGNENPAPGINLWYFDGSVSGILELSYKDCISKGYAEVEVVAAIGPDLKEELRAEGACPNPNWYVLDAVPEHAYLRDVEYEEINGQICAVAEAVFDCTLPDIETLEWVYYPDAPEPYWGFERRQYNCTLEETFRYKTPQDCIPLLQ